MLFAAATIIPQEGVVADNIEGLFGENYESIIIYDSATGSSASSVQRFNSSELKDLKEYIHKEEILEIFVYKSPLVAVSFGPVYHAFIIFRTHTHWWSLEKDTHHVILQQAREFRFVRTWTRDWDDSPIRRKAPVRQLLGDKGRGQTTHDLVDFLSYKHLASSPYNLVASNCQHFAKAIFDQFAKTRQWFP